MSKLPFGETDGLPVPAGALTGEQMNFLVSWAKENNCELVMAGQCGFGRECVGITYGNAYIDFGYLSMDYKNEMSRAARNEISDCTPDLAYHKDDCLCVLGTDYESQFQLYTWVKGLADRGFKVRTQLEADLGPGTTTISMLMTGRRATIGVLYKPEKDDNATAESES